MIGREDALVRALAARDRDGTPGRADGTVLAAGPGWRVCDVVCTSGPGDRAHEERHPYRSIAAVIAGTFRYRSAHGRALLSPGSLLLGNAGQAFCCDHDHARGDRCVAFQYDPALFEEIAGDVRGRRGGFRLHRLAPARETAWLLAEVRHGLARAASAPWEELAVALAGRVLSILRDVRATDPPGSATEERRVTDVLRFVDSHLDEPLALARLAALARTSKYHFLRSFRRATGLSPHQYVMRRRLDRAAFELRTSRRGVLEIAVAAGFGDLSNFHHAFKREFGATPGAYRSGAAWRMRSSQASRSPSRSPESNRTSP